MNGSSKLKKCWKNIFFKVKKISNYFPRSSFDCQLFLSPKNGPNRCFFEKIRNSRKVYSLQFYSVFTVNNTWAQLYKTHFSKRRTLRKFRNAFNMSIYNKPSWNFVKVMSYNTFMLISKLYQNIWKIVRVEAIQIVWKVPLNEKCVLYNWVLINYNKIHFL